MKQPREQLLEEFVDFLLPLLNPAEVTIYLYLLRRSHLASGMPEIRVGKKTIMAACGQATRAARSSYFQVTKVLNALEVKTGITIRDTNRLGTLYSARLPLEVPAARERIAASAAQPLDYYRDSELRMQLFERDNWTCRYCGEQVSDNNATLDHFIPASNGGPDSAENLVTCCLLCNSIKLDRTYEEAAPAILDSLLKRRARGQAGT